MWQMRNLFAVLSTVLFIYTIGIDAKCGYQVCPTLKSNLINVHVVPHTHDDVGWLKTVDQYYYGHRNNIQRAGVQYILDSVVTELLKNKNRRFIWVETAFLMKWYNEQTADVKKSFKGLIDDGRLEIIGGGWSMNDEAAVHYQSVIDQFTYAFKNLNDNFGSCARPRVAWQIDMFGHSREMASTLAQMGFDGVFFARLDWNDKRERLNNLTAEFIWKGSADLAPTRSELFTGILKNHYSAPPGYCFDTLCSDAPIIDGESYDNNVQARVDEFLNYATNMAKQYRDTNIMMPFGDDFNFQDANMYFKNLDKLIKYVNARQAQGSKINLVYSTPSCYLNALHEARLTWPNKTLDFFPYATDPNAYWTGYYSSRANQKRFERLGNHLLQTTKQLTAIANLTGTAVNTPLNKLRDAMGVMQHHDAITGTEKQHVSNDYDRLLSAAMVGAQSNTRAALQKLTNLTTGEFVSCLQLNISICEFTQQSVDRLVVTLFNPLAHPSTQFVRVPVKNGTYVVKDSTGRAVRSQVIALPKEVVALKFRPNATQHELVFEAYVNKVANYYVEQAIQPRTADEELTHNRISIPARFQQRRAERLSVEPEVRADTIVENSMIRLTFNDRGHLSRVRMNGVEENVLQEFYYYKSAAGNNAEFKNRSSGAYIFRPNGTEILANTKAEITVIKGAIVTEVHQKFNNWISQVVRLYDGVNQVEFEWLVGPIPIADGVGKEVITRFTSSIASNNKWETDSNGREMILRTRNEREYFKPNMTETVSGNYVPVTSRISIKDSSRRLTLLNDRSQGGTSIKNGVVELMVHRRCLRDDAFGVGEALNETAYGDGIIARGKVWLILSPISMKPTTYERIAEKQIHLPFWAFFSNATKAVNKVLPKIPDFSSLPLSINLLTLEPYSDKEYLLRLENYMDGTETQTVKFNLRTLFDNLNGDEIRETALDGILPLSDMKRFKFSKDGTARPSKAEYYTSQHVPLAAKKKDAISKFDVIFDPMQTRTFIIKK